MWRGEGGAPTWKFGMYGKGGTLMRRGERPCSGLDLPT